MDERNEQPDRAARAARAERRAFIRTHHPDRGGDPAAFVTGLRTFDGGENPGSVARARVYVVDRGTWPRRLARRAVDRVTGRRSAPRVR